MSCCWLIYGGCEWCRGGGVLVGLSNNCFFTTKHNSITFGTQCKLCTRAAAAAVAVNKERSPMGPRADGADVVFTDTRNLQCSPDLLARFEGAASQ